MAAQKLIQSESVLKLTKIVATIGPASDTPEKIESLIKAGVNVFRFNMKHNEASWHLERIERVQKIADKLDAKIGIMVDLQGPEIRIKTSGDRALELKESETLFFAATEEDLPEQTTDYVLIPQEAVIEALEEGDKFSIEDGFHNFEVVKKHSEHALRAKILGGGGLIRSNKSMNLVGKDVALPSLIDADLDKLNMAAKAKVDFIALSFVRTKTDLLTLRKEVKEREMNVHIVSKVESQLGLDNVDEIIEYSDAVMIARGDLGIETPLEKLPYFQKLIINKCREAAKPVIVATQMLDSMISHPLPTRAEAADVAGAVYDGTDAVMLSGESAVGKYPVRAAQFMARISSFNEKHSTASKDYIPDSLDQTHAVIKSALSMLSPFSGVNIDKLVVGTQSGYTARVFSSYRPKVPILALSDNKKTIETLTLTYGVVPVYVDLLENPLTDPEILMSHLKSEGFLHPGDTILLVHGKRIKDPGNTNSLAVFTVS